MFEKVMEKLKDLMEDSLSEWNDGVYGDDREDCVEWFKDCWLVYMMEIRKLLDIRWGMREVDGCIDFDREGMEEGKYDEDVRVEWNRFIDEMGIMDSYKVEKEVIKKNLGMVEYFKELDKVCEKILLEDGIELW